MNSPGRLIHVLAIIALLLYLDVYFGGPKTVVQWHHITGNPTVGPAVPCGWDYEGRWMIGLAHGTSPVTLQYLYTDEDTSDYKTKISQAPPPKIIPTLPAPVNQGGHQVIPPVHMPHHYYPPEPMIDLNEIPVDPAYEALIDRFTGAALTCEDVDNGDPVSFVADPFLYIDPRDETHWYLFFESKNLVAARGELSVSESHDSGLTWKHLGTVLSEPYHLSYPLVVYDAPSDTFVMIPETGKDLSIQYYTTSSSQFPFGWKSTKKVLTGERFVDSSVVLFEGTWYMFTTVGPELRLYWTDDFMEGHWREHPASPVAVGDDARRRSGGRPVVFDNAVHRFAQNGNRDFYGLNLFTYRITELTRTSFKEVLVGTYMPKHNGKWNSELLHHIDAHQLSNGHWVAVMDGHSRPPHFDFRMKEGWFVTLKWNIFRVCLAIWVVYVACTYRPYIAAKAAASYDFSCRSAARLKSVMTNTRGNFRQLQIWPYAAALILTLVATAIFIFAILPHLVCDVGVPRDKYVPRQSPTPIVSSTNASLTVADVVIVTAGSSAFFDRLQNLVGSVHFWEPNMRVLIWDLGLTPQQVQELGCWKNVEVRVFDFSKYPEHFRIVTNFAWKPWARYEALQDYPAMLFFDAGIELRAPITEIKQTLLKYGYWYARQPSFVARKTYPQTYEKLDADRRLFVDKQDCSGGLLGYVRGSDAYYDVLGNGMRCALDPNCYAPPRPANLSAYDPPIYAHNFDQSVDSVNLYKYGLFCVHEEGVQPDFKGSNIGQVPRDETRVGNILVFARRWHRPRPYVKYLVNDRKCIAKAAQSPSHETRQHLTVTRHNFNNGQKDKTYEALLACLRKSHFDYAQCQPQLKAQAQHEKNIAMQERYSWKHLIDWLEAEGWRFIQCLSSIVIASLFSLCFYLSLVKFESFLSSLSLGRFAVLVAMEVTVFAVAAYVAVYVD